MRLLPLARGNSVVDLLWDYAGSLQLDDVLTKHVWKFLQSALLKCINKGLSRWCRLAQIMPRAFDTGNERFWKRRMQIG